MPGVRCISRRPEKTSTLGASEHSFRYRAKCSRQQTCVPWPIRQINGYRLASIVKCGVVCMTHSVFFGVSATGRSTINAKIAQLQKKNLNKKPELGVFSRCRETEQVHRISKSLMILWFSMMPRTFLIRTISPILLFKKLNMQTL